jgi:DNA-binding XRE family transcriptional regulator
VTETAAAAALDATEPPEEGEGGYDTLRHVVIGRVLPAVALRLRAEGRPLQAAASDALRRGLGESAVLGDAAGQPYAAGFRPLALTISAPARESVSWLARAAFHGDERAAVGWLLARGVGMRMDLPSAEAGARSARGRTLRVRRPFGPTAATPSPRRRRASAAADVDAPTGEALRQMREALGIAQRELAAHAGLSRGLVAEVERGRRTNGLTRLRLWETLRSLQRSA